MAKKGYQDTTPFEELTDDQWQNWKWSRVALLSGIDFTKLNNGARNYWNEVRQWASEKPIPLKLVEEIERCYPKKVRFANLSKNAALSKNANLSKNTNLSKDVTSQSKAPSKKYQLMYNSSTLDASSSSQSDSKSVPRFRTTRQLRSKYRAAETANLSKNANLSKPAALSKTSKQPQEQGTWIPKMKSNILDYNIYDPVTNSVAKKLGVDKKVVDQVIAEVLQRKIDDVSLSQRITYYQKTEAAADFGRVRDRFEDTEKPVEGEKVTSMKVGDITCLIKEDVKPIQLNLDELGAIVKKYSPQLGEQLIKHRGIHYDVPVQHRNQAQPLAHRYNAEQLAAIEKQLEKYVQAQYLRERRPDDQCYARAPLRAVFKDGQKIRLCMDAKAVNRFFVPPEVQLPNITSPLMRGQNKWFIKIDFSDAFMHIPLSKELQSWFTFRIGGKEYVWERMGFGWNMAPVIFQTITSSLILHTCSRWKGVNGFNLYDDNLFMADSEEWLTQCSEWIQDLCNQLGLEINLNKSVLKPVQTIDWIGFCFTDGGVRLTKESVSSYEDKVKSFVALKTYKELISLLGYLQWAVQIWKFAEPVVAGLQSLVPIEIRNKPAAHNNELPEEEMKVFLDGLYKISQIVLNNSLWRPEIFKDTYVVSTDWAKGKYYGFSCEGRQHQIPENSEDQKEDQRDERETTWHELRAIYYVVENVPRECNLIIRTDCQNAYFAIKHCRSSSTEVRDLVSKLLIKIFSRRISMMIVKVAGSDNKEADSASRRKLRTEGDWNDLLRKVTAKEKELTREQYMAFINHSFDKNWLDVRKRTLALLSSKYTTQAFETLKRQISTDASYYQGHSAIITGAAYLYYIASRPTQLEDAAILRDIEVQLLAARAVQPELIEQALRRRFTKKDFLNQLRSKVPLHVPMLKKAFPVAYGNPRVVQEEVDMDQIQLPVSEELKGEESSSDSEVESEKKGVNYKSDDDDDDDDEDHQRDFRHKLSRMQAKQHGLAPNPYKEVSSDQMSDPAVGVYTRMSQEQLSVENRELKSQLVTHRQQSEEVLEKYYELERMRNALERQLEESKQHSTMMEKKLHENQSQQVVKVRMSEELSEDNQNLKRQVESLQGENQNISEKYSVLEQMHDKLAKQLEESKQHSIVVEKKLHDLQAKQNSQSQAEKDSKAELNSLQKKYSALEKKCSEVQKLVDNEKRTSKQTREEADLVVADLQKELSNSKKELVQNEEIVEKSRVENENLKKTILSNTKELKQLKSMLDQEKDQCKQLHQKLAEAERCGIEEAEKFKSFTIKAENQLQTAIAEASNQQQKLLQSEQLAQKKHSSELETLKKTCEERIKVVEQQVKLKQGELDKLKEEMKIFEQDRSKQVGDLQREILQLTLKIQASDKQYSADQEARQSERAKADRQLEEARAYIEELKQQIDILIAEIRPSCQRVGLKLGDSFIGAKDTLKALFQKVKAGVQAKQEADEKVATIERLSEQLQVGARKNSALTKEVETLQTQLAIAKDYEQQLNQAREELRRSQQSCSEQLGRNQALIASSDKMEQQILLLNDESLLNKQELQKAQKQLIVETKAKNALELQLTKIRSEVDICRSAEKKLRANYNEELEKNRQATTESHQLKRDLELVRIENREYSQLEKVLLVTHEEDQAAMRAKFDNIWQQHLAGRERHQEFLKHSTSQQEKLLQWQRHAFQQEVKHQQLLLEQQLTTSADHTAKQHLMIRAVSQAYQENDFKRSCTLLTIGENLRRKQAECHFRQQQVQWLHMQLQFIWNLVTKMSQWLAEYLNTQDVKPLAQMTRAIQIAGDEADTRNYVQPQDQQIQSLAETLDWKDIGLEDDIGVLPPLEKKMEAEEKQWTAKEPPNSPEVILQIQSIGDPLQVIEDYRKGMVTLSSIPSRGRLDSTSTDDVDMTKGFELALISTGLTHNKEETKRSGSRDVNPFEEEGKWREVSLRRHIE